MEDENFTKAAGTAGGKGENGMSAENGVNDENGVSAEARRMKDDAKAKAVEMKEGARAKVRQTKAAVKSTVDDARKDAGKRVDRWTGRMGTRVEHVAGALRAASDSLNSQGESALAGVADSAAERVTRVGGYLEDEDAGSMMTDLREMGRRNPAAFLGGAFAVGLAAGRFFRASRPERDDPEPDDGIDSGRPDLDRARSSTFIPHTTTPISASSGTGTSDRHEGRAP